jgi:hypothetical protein
MDAELYKPFELVFKVFKSFGMWQDGNQTWRYFFCGFAFHFCLIYVFFILEFIYGFRSDSLVNSIDALGVGFAVFAEAFKSINFFVKIRKIGKLLESLNELLKFSADERFADRAHIRKTVKFTLKVHKILWVTAMTSCVGGAFVPIFALQLPYKA